MLDALEPEYEYDWDKLAALFKQPTKIVDFQTIEFVPTSTEDKNQLPIPKYAPTDRLYTASFFCRDGKNWFIYRVIYPVSRFIMPEEKNSIYKKLEIGARTTMDIHRRAKDPYKYLRDIEL